MCYVWLNKLLYHFIILYLIKSVRCLEIFYSSAYQTAKLRSDLSGITICWAIFYQLTNDILFQYSVEQLTWRLTYVVLLLATKMFYISIVVEHLVLLYSWQWRVALRHTENASLCFHCNSGHANAPQFYVTRRCLSCINYVWTLCLNQIMFCFL
jgi:hypothetical protein